MALSVYATLFPYFVSLTPAQSVWGIRIEPTPAFPQQDRYLFGTVNDINNQVYRVRIGDTVLFDTNQAVLAIEGNDLYYITQQENIIFKEAPAS